MRNRWLASFGVVALGIAGLVALAPPNAGAAAPAAFSVGDASLVEGNAAGTRELKIPITLSDPVNTTTTVTAALVAGSAAPGVDYVPFAPKVLTFASGVVKKVVTVKVNADTIPEGSETFGIALSAPTSPLTVLRGSGTGTIVDDDPPGALKVNVGDVAVVEGNSGTKTNDTVAQFAVTLSATSLAAVSVKYTTASGTATSGTDFTGIPTKTVTFPAGSYKKYVTVKVTRDQTTEPDETFSIVLSAPSGVTVGRGTGTGTIVDDEAPPAPVITGTAPLSPAASATPSVLGTSEAGTTVSIFLNATCTGPAAASGSAASFGGAGIGVSVPVNVTTSLSARATDALLLTSPCSSASSYTNNTVIRTGLAWGRGDSGQIGDGSSGVSGLRTLTPTVVLADAAVVAAASSTSIAIKGDGTLWSWGYNGHGELGDSTPTGRTTPVQVGTATDWADLAAGDEHVLALKDDGSLWAWGYNAIGQVGDGTGVDRLAPTHIGTSTWTAIAAGSFHSLAVRSDGTLWGWGHNGQGQVGDGTTTHRFTPVQIGTDTDWVDVDAGFAHSIARKADGTIWAWGWNQSGQLGDGTTGNSAAPAQVGTDTDWTAINAGGDSTLAQKADGTLWSWGDNTVGTLGRTGSGLVPAQIGTDTDWARFSLSPCSNINYGAHVLAIKANGTLWGWGYNGLGQLGVGSYYGVQASPLQVGTATDWSTVVAGCETSLGVEST